MVSVWAWVEFVGPNLDHDASTSIDRLLRIDREMNRRRRRKGKIAVPVANTLFGVNRYSDAKEVIAWDKSHWRDEVSRCLWQ